MTSDPEFVRSFRELGIKDLEVAHLVALIDHGLTAETLQTGPPRPPGP